MGGVAYLWLGWRDASRTIDETRIELAARSAERDSWRGRAEKTLRGLGEEIDRQLQEWDLTPVERETALLLLKGFGHKEIASLQAKSERTVRQHAVAVYRKSGLSGDGPHCQHSSSRTCYCPRRKPPFRQKTPGNRRIACAPSRIECPGNSRTAGSPGS